MRRGVVAFVVTFVLGASGIDTAGFVADRVGGPLRQDNNAGGNEQVAGVHGGPIDRLHQAASCDLTDISSLPGNWTHGDYVTAVAADGTAAQIGEAAHSDCGKPMVAVGHGGGPPAHANAGGNGGGPSSHSNAGGNPNGRGSDAPGS